MKLDEITDELSCILKSPDVRGVLTPMIAQMEHSLSVQSDQPQVWKSLPLDFLPCKLPSGILSCWLFVLRANAKFGAERHPNSHQRSVALSGSALFELFERGSWISWPLTGGAAEPGSASAISIPPSVWHRIQIGAENFVSASFHTIPVEQLIEETPIGDNLSVTKQRRYHA